VTRRFLILGSDLQLFPSETRFVEHTGKQNKMMGNSKEGRKGFVRDEKKMPPERGMSDAQFELEEERDPSKNSEIGRNPHSNSVKYES